MYSIISSQPLWLNILIAFIGFHLVLFVHETGHYLFNRYYGVEVDEVEIGMGPSIKIGKFKLGLFPVGGVNHLKKDYTVFEKENVNQMMLFKTLGGIIAQLVLGVILFILPSPVATYIGFINMLIMLDNIIPLSTKTDGYKAIMIIKAFIKGEKVELLNR